MRAYLPIILTLTLLPAVPPAVPPAPTAGGASSPLSAAAVVFEIDPPDFDRVDTATLNRVAGIQSGGRLDARAYQNACKNLYQLGIFQKVAVYARPVADGECVIFRLSAYPRLERLELQRVRRFNVRTLMKELGLARGVLLTEAVLAAAHKRLLELYREAGYLEATGELQLLPQGRLRIVVTEGRRHRLMPVQVELLEGAMLPAVRGVISRLSYQYLSQQTLERAVRDIRQRYHEAGYPAVRIERFESPGRLPASVQPVILLETGPSVAIRVEGAELSPAEIRNTLAIYRLGDVSAFAEELSRNDVKTYLEGKGRVVTAVESRREEDPATGRIEVVFQVESIPRRKIPVILTGNESFTRPQIVEGVALPVTVPHIDAETAEPLAKEVRALYAAAGWLDAQVDWAAAAEGGRDTLQLDIREGPRYLAGDFTLGENFPHREEFAQRLEAFQDQPYTAGLVEQLRQTVIDFCSGRGFIVDRLVFREERVDHRVNLTLEPELAGPYQVDNVVVIGSGATVPREMNKLVRLQDGGPLDIQSVYQAESRLYGSGIFEDVTVTVPTVYGRENSRNVILKLVEAPRYTFGYGFGYQEFEGFRGLLEWTDNNFLGRTLSLGTLFRLSEKKILGQVSLNDQDLFWGRYPLTLSVYGLQEDRVSFKTKRFSIVGQSSVQTGRNTIWLFRLGFENITNYDIQEGLDPGEIERDEQPITLPSLAVTYVSDTRDNLMDPSRGRQRTFTVMMAPEILGADTGFTKLYFQEQDNFRLGARVIAALSLRVGWILNHSSSVDVPISEKFFAGGSSTLRAYETERAGPLDPVTNEPLGGNALIIGNAELRFPLYRLIHGALFYDIGNVFTDMTSVRWRDVSHIVGFGFRINTPVVPIRLDFGLSLKDIPNARDNQFYITIGNPF